jgi:hypothetical protein
MLRIVMGAALRGIEFLSGIQRERAKTVLPGPASYRLTECMLRNGNSGGSQRSVKH